MHRTGITKDDITITKLHVSDVLFGRGSQSVRYEGNVAFHQMIKTRQDEYKALSMSKKTSKDQIAREIYQCIIEKGGRFLRPVVDSIAERAEFLTSLPSNDDQSVMCWVMVVEDMALIKIKQVFADKGRYRYLLSKAKKAFKNCTSPIEGGHGYYVYNTCTTTHYYRYGTTTKT